VLLIGWIVLIIALGIYICKLKKKLEVNAETNTLRERGFE
jgi:hypothetical protein